MPSFIDYSYPIDFSSSFVDTSVVAGEVHVLGRQTCTFWGDRARKRETKNAPTARIEETKCTFWGDKVHVLGRRILNHLIDSTRDLRHRLLDFVRLFVKTTTDCCCVPYFAQPNPPKRASWRTLQQ